MGWNDFPQSSLLRLSRRRLLRSAVRGGAGLALGGALSSCGRAAPVELSPAGTPPRRGGRLRIGIVGAGESETLDPNKGSTEIDDARNFALFEGLTKLERDGSISNNLARTLTPNRDATTWTVTLEPDVLFHDGKPLHADDVIYSLRYVLDERNGALGRSYVAMIDADALRRIDARTIEIGLTRPNSFLPEFLAEHRVRVVPEGTRSFARPIGTGPWKFQSFSRGARSLFTRNREYRKHDGPFLDELEYIVLDDSAARLNALLAELIDVMVYLDPAQIGAIASNPRVALLEGESMNHAPLVMQVSASPFDDPRVREAFRLIVDREQMVANALSARGRIGNDLQSWADRNYADKLPQRTADSESARALLDQAGAAELTIDLHTSAATPGMLESATLFAEQARSAGVDVAVRKYPPSEFWSSIWMKRPFFSTDWAGRSLVPQFFTALTDGAPFNETDWSSKEFARIVDGALSTSDARQQRRALIAAQRLLHREGGYIVWGFRNALDAHSVKVRGLQPSVFRTAGGHDYLDVWLDD